MRILLMQIVGVACFVPAVAAPQTAFYQVEHLTSLASGSNATPHDINFSGDVAGEARRLDGSLSAVVWSDGGFTDLGADLGSESSGACGISHSALVVGQRGAGCEGPGPLGAEMGAILWDEGDLYEIPDRSQFFDGAGARAVNGVGTVVGWSASNLGVGEAASWDSASLPGILGTFPMSPTGSTSLAHDVNQFDQAVGWARRSLFPFPPAPRATLWDGSTITDLGSLLEGGPSYAHAINDLGTIVGYSPAPSPPGKYYSHGVAWTEGEIADLGTLLVDNEGLSRAEDINGWGLIVGSSDVVSVAGQHAVLWKGGRIVDLNDLIDDADWTLIDARAVNDRGDIVGTGFLEGVGGNQAFKLTHLPAPEPTLSLMLLCGSTALAGLAGKKRGR